MIHYGWVVLCYLMTLYQLLKLRSIDLLEVDSFE